MIQRLRPASFRLVRESVAGGVPRPLRRRWCGRATTAVLATVALVACAPSDPDGQALTARGEELYGANCAACHGGATGGQIGDIPPPHNAQGHTWHHPDCELERIVLEGMPPRPGLPTMPPFGDTLDEDEVEAILAYIKTWWEPDQRDFQGRVTAQACE